MPSLAVAVLAVVILAALWLMPEGAGRTLGLALGIVLPVVLVIWGVLLFRRRLGGR